MKFLKGERVTHPRRPDWGLGEVIDDSSDTLVRVCFVGVGEKTLKLEFAPLIKVDGDAAINSLLDGRMNANRTWSKRPKKNGKSPSHRSLPLLIEDFRKLFPQGFQDTDYFRCERDYKDRAQTRILTELNKEDFESLLDAKMFDEVCRRALQIANATNLIFPNERMDLRDGLKTSSGRQEFSETLFSLLYGEGGLEERFQGFANCLQNINAAKWTTQTYFPFLKFPSDQMFLKPQATQMVAGAYGFELNYRTDPNWLTYSKLLELAHHLFDALSEFEPRDLIDVQSFIWCVWKIGRGGYNKGD